MSVPGRDAPDLRTQPGPHVFVSDLDELRISLDDRQHLERSLRLRAGDRLTVSDGRGRWRSAAFGPELAAIGDIHEIEPPAYDIGVAISLTKRAKPELVVQKATELGIDRICVFEARHSVVRWDDDRTERARRRLGRVAREAAMQSRRVRLPEIELQPDLASVAATHPVVRLDFGGSRMSAAHRFLAVGPEGGWHPDEVALVPQSVDLGPTVLRAETAAIVAAGFLAHMRHLDAG